MRKLSVLVASALAFGLAPSASTLGMLGGSGALVGLGVLLAAAASEGVSSLAIACGAVGALAGSVLGTVSPAIGGAALVGLAYAERTSRVRGGRGRLSHVAASVVAGGAAGALVASYAGASPVVRGVAIVVASVLVAIPMLIEADDAIALRLDLAADEVSEPAKTWLKEGAEIRRESRDTPLDLAAAIVADKAWRALQRLAEARVRLEKPRRHAALAKEPPSGTEPYRGSATEESAQSVVDQRIAEHVKTLATRYSAAETAQRLS
jgi:hypothetical protein